MSATPSIRPTFWRCSWLLPLLCALAFCIRLGAVAATGFSVPQPGSDEAEYDACAWNLVQGKGMLD